MRIRWPRLTFPPINLWTAPLQPALEDTMSDFETVPVGTLERLEQTEAERDALVGNVRRLRHFRSAVCGWRENDWPEGFCRRTAELVADHGRQAEGEIAQGGEVVS